MCPCAIPVAHGIKCHFTDFLRIRADEMPGSVPSEEKRLSFNATLACAECTYGEDFVDSGTGSNPRLKDSAVPSVFFRNGQGICKLPKLLRVGR